MQRDGEKGGEREKKRGNNELVNLDACFSQLHVKIIWLP
jgi:hypothetical protein